jgi:hypothetical protein
MMYSRGMRNLAIDPLVDGVGAIRDADGNEFAELTTTGINFTDRGVVLGVTADTTTAYTLVIGDAGNVVTMSNGSASTITVPPNSAVAFPIGTQVTVSMLGAGVVTPTEGAGVTINGEVAMAQFVTIVLTKILEDTWIVQD